MTKCTAIIRNKYGIHCRPAAVIAKEAQGYKGRITVTNKQGETVSAGNIMGLISLGITCGESIELTVEGPGEANLAVSIRELFETEFDFSR